MKIERVEREPQPMIGVREVVPMSDLSEFFSRAFAAAAAELARQGAQPAGPPVALYSGFESDAVDVIAGFPVSQPVTPAAGPVAATLPRGPVVPTVHAGSYEELSTTYGELTTWFAQHGVTRADRMWEEYLVGPESEADSTRWQTRILFPVR